LQGVLYLYSRKFPRALGHIQTGNIFIDGDICTLGGYENTLLGYKTRSYKLCKEHLESIDLILFGMLRGREGEVGGGRGREGGGGRGREGKNGEEGVGGMGRGDGGVGGGVSGVPLPSRPCYI
jgi:hypothetical protein